MKFRLSALLLLLAIGAGARELEIYWIDVEGGGATLIVTPAGESILIDSGNPGGRDSGRIRHVAHDVAGLRRIDHFVLTHFHADHFGGIAELAALMPIGEVHDRGIPDHSPDNNPRDNRWVLLLKPYREFAAGRRSVIRAGDYLPLKPVTGGLNVEIRCIAADQKFIPAPPGAAANPLAAGAIAKPTDTSDNANSVALVLDFGPFRFFDGGDLTWNIEGALVSPVNRVGPVDVYQVDHHGLDVSNNPLLIHSLAPTVSVMNNGARKGAAANTLSALRSSPGIEAMYQMHRNLRPGEEAGNTAAEFIANADAACAGNFIRLQVAPDGRSYTLSIPATGHGRTYQVRPK